MFPFSVSIVTWGNSSLLHEMNVAASAPKVQRVNRIIVVAKSEIFTNSVYFLFRADGSAVVFWVRETMCLSEPQRVILEFANECHWKYRYKLHFRRRLEVAIYYILIRMWSQTKFSGIDWSSDFDAIWGKFWPWHRRWGYGILFKTYNFCWWHFSATVQWGWTLPGSNSTRRLLYYKVQQCLSYVKS